MRINIDIPDSFRELVDSKTDDELSVLLQQALSFPSVTNQLKMLEAIGLSTLQSILDLKKSGALMLEQPTREKAVSESEEPISDMSVEDLDLSALDSVRDLAESDEAIVNESVFGKLRAQLLEGADLGV